MTTKTNLPEGVREAIERVEGCLAADKTFMLSDILTLIQAAQRPEPMTEDEMANMCIEYIAGRIGEMNALNLSCRSVVIETIRCLKNAGAI